MSAEGSVYQRRLQVLVAEQVGLISALDRWHRAVVRRLLLPRLPVEDKQ